MSTKTVCVFGTFNPITKAHIHIGQLAQQAIDAQEVIYVIAKDAFLNSWKEMGQKEVMDQQLRYQLAHQALQPYGFTASDVEITGMVDGKTYNTVEYLKAHGHEDIYIVMGIDKINELDRWYQAEKLLSENHFLIVDRDNIPLEEVLSTSQLVTKYQSNFTSIHDATYADVSSTKIRQAYLDHQLEKYQDVLPENIYQYLQTHSNIYQ